VLAWLVRHDYVQEVELCMLMVGHTHEDSTFAMLELPSTSRLRPPGIGRAACAPL
jgi:hypothetical protein